MTTPRVGGYEWTFTCACGQTVNLSGLATHPVPDVDYGDYDALRERIRSIEGTREFECPNPECDRTLEVGIRVVNDE